MTVVAAPNSIVVFSDLLDPFAHVAVHRLWTVRDRLGLTDVVRFDHHAFPLELFNGPGTRIGSDSEVPSVGTLEPDAGWQLWNAPDWHYPNTVLLAFEAVHAAKAQSWAVSESLDRALRRAFWADSRSIGHHNVIIEIAGSVEGLDTEALGARLAAGSSRAAVFDDYRVAATDDVAMSPQLFLPDGTSITNPGISVHWQGEWAKGFPVIDHDDPSVYETMLLAAAAR
jgi:predicted DsbA family dithiol-disulfide isomerase